jgi:hypothetical protein
MTDQTPTYTDMGEQHIARSKETAAAESERMEVVALTEEERRLAYEEKLAQLAESYAIDMTDTPTADMILSGTVTKTNINFDQFCLILPEIFADLEKHRMPVDERGKRPFTSLGYARSENYLKWLMLQEIEWMVLGGKTALSTYKLPFHPQKMDSFTEFAMKLKPYIIS